MGKRAVNVLRKMAIQYDFSQDQTIGGNVTVLGAGLGSIIYSDATTIPVATGNTDIALSIPANAIITNVGFVCTTQIDADSSSTVTMGFGLAASVSDLIAPVQVNATSADIAAGVVVDVLAGNIAIGSGTPFATFEPAMSRFSTSAATVNLRCTVGAADLSNPGAIRAFAEFVIVK